MTTVLNITTQVRKNRILRALLTFAVAYVAFVGAVFYSMDARASTININTSFVASRCGDVTRVKSADIALARVCFGDFKNFPTQHQMSAVEFTTEDGSTAIYEVKEITNLFIKLLNGAVRSNVVMVGENGDETTMMIVRQKDGSIQMAKGLVGATSYQVPNFL